VCWREPAATFSHPPRRLGTRETCNALLGKLDERSRRLVLRHLVDEIPLVDLAEEVGYSRKTVGKKYRRAIARLRTAAVGQASRRGLR
jgi:DNA-directed RNA polymerase specialized sigma24 family protein